MSAAAIISGFDGRADNRRREVEVTQARVIISRCVAGIDMRIGLDLSQFQGVALGVLIAEASDFLYTVTLTHSDPELCVILSRCDREDEARAQWRRWASKLGLNRLIERADGEYELATDQWRPSTQRRRGSLTLQRRNRFLARRKMGRPVASSRDAANELS